MQYLLGQIMVLCCFAIGIVLGGSSSLDTEGLCVTCELHECTMHCDGAECSSLATELAFLELLDGNDNLIVAPITMIESKSLEYCEKIAAIEKSCMVKAPDDDDFGLGFRGRALGKKKKKFKKMNRFKKKLTSLTHFESSLSYGLGSFQVALSSDGDDILEYLNQFGGGKITDTAIWTTPDENVSEKIKDFLILLDSVGAESIQILNFIKYILVSVPTNVNLPVAVTVFEELPYVNSADLDYKIECGECGCTAPTLSFHNERNCASLTIQDRSCDTTSRGLLLKPVDEDSYRVNAMISSCDAADYCTPPENNTSNGLLKCSKRGTKISGAKCVSFKDEEQCTSRCDYCIWHAIADDSKCMNKCKALNYDDAGAYRELQERLTDCSEDPHCLWKNDNCTMSLSDD